MDRNVHREIKYMLQISISGPWTETFTEKYNICYIYKVATLLITLEVHLLYPEYVGSNFTLKLMCINNDYVFD